MPPLLMLVMLVFIISIALLAGYLIMGRQQVIHYEPIDGVLYNPLMGWAPWANDDEILQPHTLVYADVTWRELEPREGEFDFSTFEEKQQFCRWRAEGVRVVFRFVMDKPGKDEHIDIPDWLYAKTAGNGDHYENDYGKGYSPDYSDPVLIEAHRKVIQALGDRYGGDGFLAYIELGSLGHWGEWHVNSSDDGIRPLPNEAVRDQYVIHYVESFPKTHLLMRRPFRIAGRLGLGIYNDMTGHPEATRTWLGWIADGGKFNQTGEVDALAAMLESWQTAPIGGEQTGSFSNEEIYGQNLDDTVRMLRDSHATFIGPRGPYRLPPGNPLQAGMDQALEAIGYRLYIREVKMPEQVRLGRVVKGSIFFANNGIAPMYYDWPIGFFLLDEGGQQRVYLQVESKLASLLPGQSLRVDFSLPIEQLPDGVYTLGVAVIDPINGQPAVQMAMEDTRDDRVQPVGKFHLQRLFGNGID